VVGVSDEPDRLEVEFEHRNGWQQGSVSLPSGLRDRAEIDGGTFTVDFPASESLISNPTFVRLVDAGHTPVGGVPVDEQQAVQQRLGSGDATDDTSSDDDGDSDSTDADTADDSNPDELDDMDRSELYEHAHKLDAVPDDDIPTWNDSTAPGLRELIREHTE
jgi:hypothetical protein